MRILHTADWHLGQQFYGHDRDIEQASFLDTLLELMIERRTDALLIAGDIFDVTSPSIRAQHLLYDFIVRAHEALPALTIVMIAGNHDSGARIELPATLLTRLRTYARGRLHWCDAHTPDLERLIIPLPDTSGEIGAWCLAMPFLRPAEVTGPLEAYTERVGMLHRQLFELGEQRRQPGQALIGMAHAHVHGGQVSKDSERPIVIGGEEAISTAMMPDHLDYVALGHLHRPQQVGAEHIRYAGSPYPLDFSERHYPHQVVDITVNEGRVSRIESLRLPVCIAMLRVGPVGLDDLKRHLDELQEPSQDTPRELWPWLNIQVLLDAPCIDLRAQIDTLLDGRRLRLVTLNARYRHADTMADTQAAETLSLLGPTGLFARHWEHKIGEPPDEQVCQDFAWLLVQAESEAPS